jgi:glycosyltransferase involved in cell wall biosynthesis
MKNPRIAIFSDSYYEPNGVSRTVASIEACAKRRNLPLLSVHAGPETRLVHDGSIVRLDLKRAWATSLGLDHDLKFDVSLWRHASHVGETLKWFAPDVLHFTGPSDVGQLGAYLGHRLSIPMVGSWHTNLHKYASRRVQMRWATDEKRARAKTWVEDKTLQLLMTFYKIPRVILAPNRELASFLERETGKPTFVMSRGVNNEVFTPARRRQENSIVNIGYVGRLSAEKNVRFLRDIESELDAEGLDVRFTIVGDGSEREWLSRHMRRAEFTGVLRGDALANTFAQMDVFAFPSEIDTGGNAVLEAMASGVPPVVMATGGQRFIVEANETAVIAPDKQAFIQGVRMLVKNRERRHAMGAAARARTADLLSWDRMFIDVCNAYDAAMTMAEGDTRTPLALSPA